MTPQLKRLHFSNATFLIDKESGYFPYFQWILRSRINKKKAVNIVVSGEAGEGKSYTAFILALLLDKKFTVNQIVYTYAEYMKLLRRLRMGGCIVFDEPSYAMSKREWYKQINKVLVQTIESQRFKVHPLIIPIINKSLLDKTIRDHLIQFQVEMRDRGRAEVYRIQASQKEDKIYYHYICELRYKMIGSCQRDSCLGCRKLNQDCQEFRAQYERKKATVQDQRYEQAEADAAYVETRSMTDQQIAQIAYTLKDKILNDKGELSAKKLRVVLLHKLKIKIGYNRAYTVKELLRLMHPDEFE